MHSVTNTSLAERFKSLFAEGDSTLLNRYFPVSGSLPPLPTAPRKALEAQHALLVALKDKPLNTERTAIDAAFSEYIKEVTKKEPVIESQSGPPLTEAQKEAQRENSSHVISYKNHCYAKIALFDELRFYIAELKEIKEEDLSVPLLAKSGALFSQALTVINQFPPGADELIPFYEYICFGLSNERLEAILRYVEKASKAGIVEGGDQYTFMTWEVTITFALDRKHHNHYVYFDKEAAKILILSELAAIFADTELSAAKKAKLINKSVLAVIEGCNDLPEVRAFITEVKKIVAESFELSAEVKLSLEFFEVKALFKAFVSELWTALAGVDHKKEELRHHIQKFIAAFLGTFDIGLLKANLERFMTETLFSRFSSSNPALCASLFNLQLAVFKTNFELVPDPADGDVKKRKLPEYLNGLGDGILIPHNVETLKIALNLFMRKPGFVEFTLFVPNLCKILLDLHIALFKNAGSKLDIFTNLKTKESILTYNKLIEEWLKYAENTDASREHNIRKRLLACQILLALKEHCPGEAKITTRIAQLNFEFADLFTSVKEPWYRAATPTDFGELMLRTKNFLDKNRDLQVFVVVPVIKRPTLMCEPVPVEELSSESATGGSPLSVACLWLTTKPDAPAPAPADASTDRATGLG